MRWRLFKRQSFAERNHLLGFLVRRKSGTFSFTVNDDNGNGTGSATFSSRTYALSGGVSSNGSFVMDMPGAGGRISGSAGSAGSSGLNGNWYADLPVSTSSATTQAYSGLGLGLDRVQLGWHFRWLQRRQRSILRLQQLQGPH